MEQSPPSKESRTHDRDRHQIARLRSPRRQRVACRSQVVSRRSREPTRAPVAVGDLRAEAVAWLSRRPTRGLLDTAGAAEAAAPVIRRLVVEIDAVHACFPGRCEQIPEQPWPHHGHRRRDRDPGLTSFRFLSGIQSIAFSMGRATRHIDRLLKGRRGALPCRLRDKTLENNPHNAFLTLLHVKLLLISSCMNKTRASTGARLVDVARKAKVSHATVAAALSGTGGNTRISAETRERIRRAAAELQYRPNPHAQQLRGVRSDVIGLIIGTDNAQVNFDRMAELERIGFERGHRFIIGLGRAEDQQTTIMTYVRDFQMRSVAGMIWLHQPPQPSEVDAASLTSLRHAVFLDRPLVEGAAAVRVDYADGIRQAVRHLVQRGRRRIGMALHTLDQTRDWTPMTDRLRGYREELSAQGLKLNEQLVWASEGPAMPSDEDIERAVRVLVREQRADAILASNDIWAVRLVKALKRHGQRLPEDVAVVGFDNLSLAAACDPELTTIDQRHEEFAIAVMDLLREQLESKGAGAVSRVVTIRPRLVVRASA